VVNAGLFAAFLLAGLCLYYPGLHEPMLYDSKGFISEQEHVFHRHKLAGALGFLPQRPLLMASFYGNYLLDGVNPFSFRVVNLALLALAGLAVTLLIRMVLQTQQSRLELSHPFQWILAPAGGLFFVIHPVQIYVTLYIWQRAAILACVFYYAAVAAYLAVRTGRIPKTSGYIAVATLFTLGMLSKENVVTLPAAILLAELVLLGSGGKTLLRKAAVVAAGSVPAVIAYLSVARLMHHAGSLGAQGVSAGILSNVTASGLSPLEILLSPWRMPFNYLAVTVAPGLVPVSLVKPMEVSQSLLEPWTTLAAIVALVAMVILAAWLIRRTPIVSFGLLFYFVALLPELLLSPHHLYYGHRAVLPLPGLLLVAVGLVVRLQPAAPRSNLSTPAKCAGAVLLVLVFIAYAAVTRSLASHWTATDVWARSYHHLPAYSANVEKVPYLEVLKNYSAALARTRKCAQIVELFGSWAAQEAAATGKPALKPVTVACSEQAITQAARLLSTSVVLPSELKASMLSNLGVVAFHEGLNQAAIEAYAQAQQHDPTNFLVVTNLGNLLLKQGLLEEAIRMQRRATELRPYVAQPWNNLGAALSAAGRLEEAVEALSRAVALNSRLDSALANYGMVLTKLERRDEAIRNVAALLADNAHVPRTRMWLGGEYQRMGKLHDAAEQFRRVVNRDPSNSRARFQLARVLIAMSRYDEASGHLRTVLSKIPNHAMALNYLGVIRLLQGKPDDAVNWLRKAEALNPGSQIIRNNLETALKAKQNQAGRRDRKQGP
jgi:tetratricopeptide (TPR) repeat protein